MLPIFAALLSAVAAGAAKQGVSSLVSGSRDPIGDAASGGASGLGSALMSAGSKYSPAPGPTGPVFPPNKPPDFNDPVPGPVFPRKKPRAFGNAASGLGM